MALVVLYTVIQQGAAARISSAFDGLTRAVQRLSDPSVALIPDVAGRPIGPKPATHPPGQDIPSTFPVPMDAGQKRPTTVSV